MSAGIQPRLIVLRGNSGAGKSSVAAGIRGRYGRGIALVGQDNLRRDILRERDVHGGANIGLIDLVARFGLGGGFHVAVCPRVGRRAGAKCPGWCGRGRCRPVVAAGGSA
ncbi:MAG: hypothetical protein ACRDOK_30570 [Streptosporangiaceae bacterium]